MFRPTMLLVLTLLLLSHVSLAAKDPDENEIRRMRVKDIKKFLDARGIECKECVEKADFVRKALSVKTIPVSQHMEQVEVSSEPLWEQWKKVAVTNCEKDTSKPDLCKNVGVVVDNLLMRYAKKYAKDLSVQPNDLTKFTFTHPYKLAGEKIIRRTTQNMLVQGTKSNAKIQSSMEKPLAAWLRDCALQNINPMYETLNEEL
eukprot:NODE_1488_length_855_cov_218.254342_g1233_i0.p1 GENE.NODE_1488_length_855_cov_218.254342_g1233_i0~~NODE_1488_length_855_cov_218.254342_g1233_i0.p1  ORF type:complete len:202 (-),score=47.03 NODE_1488_length_855_cov_218.254342_g1233_i0:179-784(-)